MSKAKGKAEKEVAKGDKQPKENTSYSIHEIGVQNDKIWKTATLTFKNSDDRGFEFETSNLRVVLRAKKEDYYSLIETLFSDVYDEFQKSDNYNGLIDDFQDFLITKMNGDN